jgi:hypothetical protein
MAKRWRCVLGYHDWRTFETPDGDKGAECSRCGSPRRGDPLHAAAQSVLARPRRERDG